MAQRRPQKGDAFFGGEGSCCKAQGKRGKKTRGNEVPKLPLSVRTRKTGEWRDVNLATFAEESGPCGKLKTGEKRENPP